MQNRPVGARGLGLTLAVICLLATVPTFAQDEGSPAAEPAAEPPELSAADDGHAQGKADARGNAIWFIPGLLLPGVGMILPWVFSPAVPSDKLIGKSDEFVAAYRTSYLRQKRLGNFLWALAGTGTTVVVVGAATIVVIVQAASGAATSCGGTIGENCSNALSSACNDSCSGAIDSACSDILTPTCSPSCASLGILPRAALAALPPP